MRFLLLLFLLSFSQLCQAQSIPYGYNEEVGKYLEVANHTRLYYEIYGEGPPLLMLHGGVFGYIDEFAPLIPKLREKYQVICLATRGHVKSDIGHEPYSYTQRAQDAYKLIQHLGLARVTVIGFSDGGFSAYKFASLYPERVEKMVVMGAANNPLNEKAESHYAADALMQEYGDYFSKRIAHMPEPKRWGESLDMLNALYNHDFISQETFSTITCPVLVMSGDGDAYASPTACLEAHQFLADSQLSIIPGCGHVVLYCNFPAVWEAMKPFLGFGESR